MKPKGLERRFAPPDVEVRSDDKETIIKGYAAVFNKWSENLGGFKEKVRKGAFRKTIEKADVRALFNHDPNYVLGRTKSNTLKLWEDDKGLGYEAILPDTSFARDLIVSIKRKDITQNSFGFRVIEDDWKSNNNGLNERELIEVELFDISPVTYPAYPQTNVKVRSLFDEAGLDFDALTALMVRKKKGLELINSDLKLIDDSIKLLRSYLPKSVQGDAKDDGNQPQERLAILRKKLEVAEKEVI